MEITRDRPAEFRFPQPEVYEEEYDYWPWRASLERCIEYIAAKAPARACVIDYMCGTGWLLNRVSRLRPDLDLSGCSLDRSHVEYGMGKYPHLNLCVSDALLYRPTRVPAVVLCTGGVHHLPRRIQYEFVRKVFGELSLGSIFILADAFTRHAMSEKERRSAVLELGAAVLSELIGANAPARMLLTAVDVLANDLSGVEYKISSDEMVRLLRPYFSLIERHHVWPTHTGVFGDEVFVCRRRARPLLDARTKCP